jgi:phage terminase large subunit
MAALTYLPREQFIPFHNRTQRWAFMNTHRRAGKTVALANDLIYGALQCQLRKPQLAYVGPTFTQAKRIAWTYLKDYAEPFLAKPPQESELKLTLKNDATIHVLGADNADALRGMYLDGTVNDEYAMFRPSVFSQVIRPALSDRNGWSVFASTPRGKNLFYETSKEAEKYPKEWYSLTLKASTSGIISLAELDALRRQMDPEEFAQEYECSFDAALKGAIYASEVDRLFAEERVRPGLYDPNLETHCVFDLGFTDSTVVIWWQVDPKTRARRIVRVRCTSGVDIFHHIAAIHEFPGEVGEVWLPHDARAKNLQTGKSVVEQFLSEGIKPRIVPNHKIRDGISAARKVFPSVEISEDDTDELVEALKSYRREWNEDLGMFSERPVHDWSSHYADAFRYFAIVCGMDELAAVSSNGNIDPNGFHLEGLWQDQALRYQSIKRID